MELKIVHSGALFVVFCPVTEFYATVHLETFFARKLVDGAKVNIDNFFALIYLSYCESYWNSIDDKFCIEIPRDLLNVLNINICL
jgi:hypothetical protein